MKEACEGLMKVGTEMADGKQLNLNPTQPLTQPNPP